MQPNIWRYQFPVTNIENTCKFTATGGARHREEVSSHAATVWVEMPLLFLVDGFATIIYVYLMNTTTKICIYKCVVHTKHVIVINMYVHQQSVIFMSCSVPA